MYSLFNNQKGSALVGVMLTLVIIAALVYGGSFFWGDKEGNSGIPATLDQYSGAKDDLTGIEKNIEARNDMMNDLLGETEADYVPELDLTKWHDLERKDNNFKLKYPQGWFYTINYKEAKEMGYDLIVGFAESEAVWGAPPPYTIDLIIVAEDKELELQGYSKEITTDNGIKYILRTGKNNLPNIYDSTADKMAEIFELLNPTSDSWKTYKNDKYGFELKYPNNWEVLENSPQNSILSISLRDEKYDKALEWAGLRIQNYDTDNEFKNAKQTDKFVISDAREEVIKIIINKAGKDYYASCALYGNPDIIETCNKIISTI